MATAVIATTPSEVVKSEPAVKTEVKAEVKAEVKTEAAPKVIVVKVEEKRKEKVGSRLAVATRREALVNWWATGNKYGNMRLLPIRFTSSSVTHDAYAKLCAVQAKKGVTLKPGLNFLDSLCYFIPSELNKRSVKPNGEEKVGGGDSGVIMYRFGTINTRPGSYMLLAATESMFAHPVAKIVEAMTAIRHSGIGSDTTHRLTMDIVAAALNAPKDPLLCLLHNFYTRWMSEKKCIMVPSEDGVKKKWVPLSIPFPSAEEVLTENQRYIIDHIIETRVNTMKQRGKAMYQKLKEEGRINLIPSKKKDDDTSSVASDASTSKPRKPRVRTEVQIAIETDRKARKSAEGIEKISKHFKVNEVGYDITPFLTQKNFLSLMFARVKDADANIGGILSDVYRFFDDAFNEVLLRLTDIAISDMTLSGSSSMTESIAIHAINSFFTSIYGNVYTDINRAAVEDAVAIGKAYTRIVENRREQEKSRAAAVSEALGEEDDDEDVFEDDAAAPDASQVATPPSK